MKHLFCRNNERKEEKGPCPNCAKLMPISDLKDHQKMCKQGTTSQKVQKSVSTNMNHNEKTSALE